MTPSRDRPLGTFVGPSAPTARVRAPAPAAAPLQQPLDGVGVDQLARAATGGNAEAVAMLYDRLVGPIYRYVALRVRHREDAEDVTQLIFERIVGSLPRYRHAGRPFEAWAFRIARNAVIDHVRRRREHAPLDAAPRSDGEGLETIAVRGEEIRELQDAIRQLTPDQQEALALRFAAGLSAEEAATIMGRRAGTIRGLTFRAIATLRRRLAARDPEARR